MTKKWDLEISNTETEPKIRIYMKNWARKVLLKIFDLVNGQRSKSTINGQINSQRSGLVNGWHVLTWQCDVTLGMAWQSVKQSWRVGARGVRLVWHVVARGCVWSACSWGRKFRRRVGARVMCFLAVLGGVFLGIFCSVTQCLCFYSWMSRIMRSESCWDCGRDGSDSLLTVVTGWRRGQRKDARDVHMNQKVRGMTLIPC